MKDIREEDGYKLKAGRPKVEKPMVNITFRVDPATLGTLAHAKVTPSEAVKEIARQLRAKKLSLPLAESD